MFHSAFVYLAIKKPSDDCLVWPVVSEELPFPLLHTVPGILVNQVLNYEAQMTDYPFE